MSYTIDIQAYQIGTPVPEWAQHLVEVNDGVTLIKGTIQEDGKWLVVLPGETMIFTVSDEGFKLIMKSSTANSQAFVQITRPTSQEERPQAQVGIRGISASITKPGDSNG